MADGVSVVWVGDVELRRQLAAVSDRVATEALTDAVMQGGQYLEGAVKSNIRKQDLIDTGRYINSWGTELTASRRDYAESQVGTNIIYGPIHEFGGVISAKNAKLLTIPVDQAARQAGPARGQDLIFVKAKSGQMFLMDKEGNIRYRLARSVRIPARPHLRPAFDENGERVANLMATSISSHIESAVAGAGGGG
jgi:phage gpG-like protein